MNVKFVFTCSNMCSYLLTCFPNFIERLRKYIKSLIMYLFLYFLTIYIPSFPILHLSILWDCMTFFIMFSTSYDIERRAFMYDIENIRNDYDSVNFIKSLLNDMNKESSLNGRTPLMMAVMHNKIEFVRQLILFGADIDSPSGIGYNLPLCASIMMQYNEITTVLIDSGAKLNQSRAILPIICAISYNCQFIIPLVQAGADIDRECKVLNITPLLKAIEIGDINVIDILLNLNVDINKSSQQITPLAKALMQQNFNITHLLLEAGANPNHYDDVTNAPAVLSINVEENQFLNLLLRYDLTLDTNVSTEIINLLLHLVAKNPIFGDKKIETLKILINAGMDKSSIDVAKMIHSLLYNYEFVTILVKYFGKDYNTFQKVFNKNQISDYCMNEHSMAKIGGYLKNSTNQKIDDVFSTISSIVSK